MFVKYLLLPLGCSTNKADAERIAGVLESLGYEPTTNEADANIIGIVACSIRQSAIDRVYGKAHIWNERKKKESLITFVSGCVLKGDEKKFLKLFDFVVHLDEVPQLPALLREYGVTPPSSFWAIAPRRSSPFKALVPIQNGCDKFCTFCAVPYTRGREVSRPSEDIVHEVEQLIASGYKQITLLGQNVNSYGLDKPKKERTFAELLDTIGSIADGAERRVWVHYTSPHPRDMNQEVYETQASHRSLAHYLNLPMQSGDNTVLKHMNRRYTIEQYMEKLDLARQIMPDITVSTDIIVGFCGETLEQFQHTQDAVERGKFDLAFIAQYSPRPGAVAHQRFPDNVPKEEKKRRHTVLTAALAVTALANNHQLIGTTVPVLVETTSRKHGKLLGRTEGLKSVEFDIAPHVSVGEFTDITITHCDSWRLFGTVQNPTTDERAKTRPFDVATPASQPHDTPVPQPVGQARR